MRFLLDANMPRAALAVFARYRHEAVFARDIGLGAALDDDIAAHAEIALILQRFLNEPAFVNSLPGRLAIVELERARFRPPL